MAAEPLSSDAPAGGLILFAGLYKDWYPGKDKRETIFTIITTTPNKLIEPIHNRIPVEMIIDQWKPGRRPWTIYMEEDWDDAIEIFPANRAGQGFGKSPMVI